MPNTPRLSRFDLPLEYHRDVTNEWGQQIDERQPRRSTLVLPQAPMERKSRFCNLNPEWLRRSLSLREHYDFVRPLAIEKLRTEMMQKLMIIYDNELCQWNEVHKTFQLPNNLFGWKREDFIKRRKLHTTWLDVLRHEVPAPCLQILKLKSDLEQLLQFCMLAFSGFLSEDEDHDINVDVIHYIEDAYDFVRLEEILRQDLAANQKVFGDLAQKLLAINFNKRDSHSNLIKIQLQEKLMDADVFDPIEVRYQLRYYASQVAQNNQKYRSLEEKLMNERQRYFDLGNMENYCSQCAMNMYYTEIEKYKTRLSILSAEYDMRFDAVENEITYKKISLDKIREQRKFFNEQIERFHEELEQLVLQELAEAEQAAQREQERLEAEALLLLKKSKKKSKKSKKK